MKDVLRKCLTAFNEIPNRKIKALNTTTYELCKEIQDCLNRSDAFTVGGWSAEDVIETARSYDEAQPLVLTEDQANEVLQHISRKADMSHGINWQTIEDGLTAWLKGKELVKTNESIEIPYDGADSDFVPLYRVNWCTKCQNTGIYERDVEGGEDSVAHAEQFHCDECEIGEQLSNSNR
jgi:hypothetical protein